MSAKDNLKNRRCTNCNSLLFKASIIKGIAEFKCDNCGHPVIVSEQKCADTFNVKEIYLFPEGYDYSKSLVLK